MEKQSQEWEKKTGRKIADEIMRDDFHAVNFDFEGIHYCFAGWWVLDIGDDEDKEYDSKEDFLNDPIFNGKRLAEVDVLNSDIERWV